MRGKNWLMQLPAEQSAGGLIYSQMKNVVLVFYEQG